MNNSVELLKTPSVQSLLDSDLESVDSLQCLDIEELDEIEYALPASEAPSLAEVLSADDEGDLPDPQPAPRYVPESSVCSALQVEFLQAVSQQVTQAQERSAAGLATALSIGGEGKLTVGTAHGHLLSFKDQILRWVCDSNADQSAVSCLAYSNEGDRLLAGFARGLICQYETSRGLILRRVTLGGEIWGILKVTWAGASGLALDTGGSVWLVKFSRPLGVRSARTSCLFSGARGEVVAMAPRDARVLALATLSRVVVVAGGRAAGARLGGAADTLPVLAWCEADERLLVCARAHTLQWLSVDVTGAAISLRPVRRFELKTVPLWLGWVGGSLAIFDVDENLRLWGDDYDKSLDLSHIEPVYASAFFKGLYTDGRVSRALCAASGGALGGAAARNGELSLLGRRGVLRVRARDRLARARALFSSSRHAQALRLLATASKNEAQETARELLNELADRPHLLADKTVADEAVRLCLKFDLSDDLWSNLWERCSDQTAFVEAIGDAAVRGELSPTDPSPECTQALIERLAESEPALVERVVASLPLTSLDPHRASVFTRSKGLWRGVGAIAAALGGSSGAMRELTKHVSATCPAYEGRCCCAGDALLLCAADALAGRGAGGRALPAHARPSARHQALQTLLTEEVVDGAVVSPSPLQVLVQHEARAAVRLLEQSWREPPFVGPLGKQNRLRVLRAALSHAAAAPPPARLAVAGLVAAAAAPPGEPELCAAAAALLADLPGEPAQRALLALCARAGPPGAALLAAAAPRPSAADLDELFEYLHAALQRAPPDPALLALLPRLAELRPAGLAALLEGHGEAAAAVLRAASPAAAAPLGRALLERDALAGAAAEQYLRVLLAAPGGGAARFLREHAGLVRPEAALRAARGAGRRDVQPLCLEAGGDARAALLLQLELLEAAADEAERARLAEEACALVARCAPAAPRAAAAELWQLLLARAGRLPPAALLPALAHVPPGALLQSTCACAGTALAVLRWAGAEARLWRAAAAALRAELAAGGAARLAACAHGARAHHAACPAPRCPLCAAPPRPLALPPRAPRAVPAPASHDLFLAAPPRPDLEGVV
ncbi:vacuolar protein sorting-associated protein 8 homolog [Plutella xylostella]|uniref:vacuolar protein sorting-associated protein 8 homolog n=1 Tax=Plutella xylostella TaxID=51655 RepID=UPI002032750D|nr:vacuolar protein sorting-associated protein 8 homolog [Plutella xylostella]